MAYVQVTRLPLACQIWSGAEDSTQTGLKIQKPKRGISTILKSQQVFE
jgi:hypothetical protein